jgi:hypothetical protein
MTSSHKANTWYTSHNMYIIFRVNIYAAEIESYKTSKF